MVASNDNNFEVRVLLCMCKILSIQRISNRDNFRCKHNIDRNMQSAQHNLPSVSNYAGNFVFFVPF